MERQQLEKRTRGQRGLAKETLELREVCQEIIEERAPITVRGVGYALFTLELIPAMDEPSLKKVSRLLTIAREEGIIDWDDIVDEGRQIEEITAYKDLKDFLTTVRHGYSKDYWQSQDCVPIVISEKSTVKGLLQPVIDHYGISFLSMHGFSSATAVHALAEMTKDDKRKLIFLYVGDWDPSGLCMSEKDLPERLSRYGGGGFLLKRIALTANDLVDLPFYTPKKNDTRYQWFVQNYGNKAYELDAMNPNILRERVRESILEYIDVEKWERCKTVEEAELESMNKIMSKIGLYDDESD